MLIAVITDVKLPKTLAGFKLKVIPWDSEKLEEENLRDYDGIIIDADSYNELDKVASPDAIENEVILPMITYDVLNAPPSLYLVVGDPSHVIWQNDILGAVGFSGTYMKGAGIQHSLTEAGLKSVYKDYLSDIKQYKYSYDTSFKTASEVEKMVRFGNFSRYTTQHVSLMQTKTGYLTAFRLQGEAYSVDGYNRILDRRSLFQKELPTFLPAHPGGFEKGLSIILQSLKERDTVNHEAEPGWASEIVVQGQEEIDAEMIIKTDQIQALELERSDLQSRRSELRKVLEVLYLSDKPLEGALKRTFQNYGYVVEEPKDDNNVEFYLKSGKQEFVIEVKSSLKPQFNKEGLRQVNEWRENESLENGKEYKPVLILSNQYDKPIEERNKESVLDENLIAFAISRKITVVTTVVLYRAFQHLAEGKITKAHLSSVLFKGEGLLHANDFYVEKEDS